MARIRTLQASYVSGEFDPTLLGRVDIEDYSKGADKLRNVYVRPQGGAFRREGLEYYAGVNGNNKARIIPFQFNDVQTYVLVFTAGRLDVYRTDNKTLQATVTTAPISNLTDDILSEINWTQSADTILLFHKDLQTIRITRTGHTSWTATAITFENIPPHSYTGITTTTPTGGLYVDGEFGEVTICAEDTPFLSSHVGQFINTPKGGRIYLTEYVSSSVMKGVVRIELEKLSVYTGTEGASPNGTTGTIGINFTNNDADESHVGRFFTTPEGGVAIVTAYQDHNDLSATVILDLESTGIINDWLLSTGYQDWELETGYEDVISATRGWPRSGTFHKSRLVLGGLKERPQTIIMSKIGDFYNLDIGQALDDEAIDVTIDDDRVNIIRGLHSGRGLSVFTSGGEFAISSDVNTSLTPGNVANQIQKQTRHGASQIRPVSVDGAVVFVEREDPNTAGSGRIVRQFVYNDAEQSFNSPNISIFSQHLVSNPVAMDIRRSTEFHPANYLYMVNDNGTCAVLNSLREQSLLAWTLFETDGLFEDVCVSGNKTFFVVKRTINGATVRYLEVLNPDNKMDSSILQTSGSPTTSWTGLDHLDGEEITVIGDSFVLEKETPSSGAITSSESVSALEAGIAFYARIKHLPMNIAIEGQAFSGEYKSPVFANVRLYNSREFVVHHGSQTSKPVLQEFAAEVSEADTTLYTKWLKVYIGGVDRDVSVEITQEVPLELNVLGVHFGVRV
jgi:hypothetical protein